MMETSRLVTTGDTGFRMLAGMRHARWVVVLLLCWVAVSVAFAVLPAQSGGRMILASGAALAAEAFAAAALVLALLRSAGADRPFLMLFGGAVLARYGGDFVWIGSPPFGVDLAAAHQAVAHIISYLLFFGAVMWLVLQSRREMTLVTLLDAASAMLGSGLLLWYFFLEPAVAAPHWEGLEALVALTQPVCDFGLLFLGLCALLTVRSSFLFLLTGGLFLLLAADGSYLWLRASGPYEFGGWPEIFWSGGVAALGLAVLQRDSMELSARRLRDGNLGMLLLWLGPLSPPLQYAALLVWGGTHSPLPNYVLLCGAALLSLFAVRTYAANRASGLLADKQEALVRQAEQGRILRELHDTAKQSARGTSMMIQASIKAQGKGDRAHLRELLGQTLELSKETSYELSKPLDELRISLTNDAAGPTAFFKERFEKFGKDFGMRTHEDLRVPLEVLKRGEMVMAHRVCVEACWNAAKHSGARNLWLETRRAGRLVVLRVRDDGCGFSPEEAKEGMGLSFMRSRAGEVGAVLCTFSRPGCGTTVELRFGDERVRA